jgi:hypothetical protein
LSSRFSPEQEKSANTANITRLVLTACFIIRGLLRELILEKQRSYGSVGNPDSCDPITLWAAGY